MKKKSILTLVSIVLLAVTACQTNTTETTTNTETVQTKNALQYAKSFTMEKKDGYQLVTVFPDWKDQTKAFRYVLYPKNTEQPADVEADVFIGTPVTSVAALSSIFCAHLEVLDALDHLKAVDHFKYIYSEKIHQMEQEGLLRELGNGANLNIESLMDLSPEVSLTFGTGDASYDVHPLLAKSQLPVVVMVEYQEAHPLGRAEWLKFTAALIGKEKEAEVYFDQLVTSYMDLKSKVPNRAERPTVLINAPYNGAWYVSGGGSFAATIVNDAGGDYLWNDGTEKSSLQLSYEEVYDKALEADYWINTGAWTTKADALASDVRNASFTAYKNDRVFNNNARLNGMGGNDIWESAVVHPDLVLQDLIGILHPSLLPDTSLYYYQKLK